MAEIPDLFSGILNGGMSAVTGYATQVNVNEPLSAYGYVKYFGPILIPFAVVGGVLALKKKGKDGCFHFNMATGTFLTEQILLVRSQDYLLPIDSLHDDAPCNPWRIRPELRLQEAQ